jgi:hypothetical protein
VRVRESFASFRPRNARSGTTDAIAEALHVGTVPTFAEAGPSEVSRPTLRRAVMRIDLG